MSSAKNRPVPRGEGILHPHKVQYSKETHQLLKVLLEESKLTILQRKSIQNTLRNGESLPSLNSGRSNKSNYRTSTSAEVKIPVFYKKRTRDAIIRSGAYEREPFIPMHPKVDKEKEKQTFQSLMAYGKVIPQTPIRKIRPPPKEPLQTPKREDRFDELIAEIHERLQFLSEMRELGFESNYRQMIDQQVGGKLREMKAIDPKRCQEFRRVNNLQLMQTKETPFATE